MTTLSLPAPDTTSVPTPDVAALVAPTPSSKDISACMRYKSLLDRFVHMESLPEATYETVNEGSSHLRRFRSTVLVGEEQFISPNVFLHKKKAEDDAAKIALESLCKEIDEENFSLIHQGSGLCKALLSQYAHRMKLEKPVYNTLINAGHCVLFASSLVFNGLTYVGRNAGTKKEAEILAAQAVLLDLIGGGDSMSRKILYIIIKSNGKHNAQLPDNHDFENAGRSAASMSNDNKPTKAISQDVPTMDSTQVGIKPVSEAALEEVKPPSGGMSTSVKQFTCPNVALHKKEAEYDVVKTAVESLSKMLKEKPVPPSFEGIASLRSVLSEYANKRRLEKAVYNTVEAPGYLPLYVSSVVFNGLTCVGKTAKTRKEAEKLAVEAVILALIGGDDSTARAIIYEIINAKMRNLASLHKKDSQNVESRTALKGNDSVPIIPTSQSEVEETQERNDLPVASVPTIACTSSVEGPSSKKRKRSKAAKKFQPEAVQEETKAPIAVVVVPPSNSSSADAVKKGEALQEGIENPVATVLPSATKTPIDIVPYREFSIPKGEAIQEVTANPVASVPTIACTASVEGPSSKKRKRNKAAKKFQPEAVQEETKAPIAVSVVPPSISSSADAVKKEAMQEGIENPVATVLPSAGPPYEGGPSSRKRKRVRARALEKMQAESIQEGTKTPIDIVPHREFSVPKGEAMQEVTANPVASVPTIACTSSVEGPSSKKRKRNKAAKKFQPEAVQDETKAPITIVVVPPSNSSSADAVKKGEAMQEGIENPVAAVLPSATKTPIDIVPHCEFSVPKGEAIQEVTANPVAFVPQSVGSSADAE